MSSKLLPDWLFMWACKALLGEIYPSIRAVAVAIDEDREMIVRYYVDRPVAEDDYESIELVITNIMANTSSASEILSVKDECVFVEGRIGSLDPLGGFVYARKEDIN